jgi:seryl-tRNA synthetase
MADPGAASEFDELALTPALPIPDHLVGEVQSKLAYVDEAIRSAAVSPAGDYITLRLQPAGLSAARRQEVAARVQRVVETMARGAIRPKVQVLEDVLDRPTPYNQDPMPALLAAGEVLQEGQGIFALGPLLARLVTFFELRFLGLAGFFNAQPYRFPTLIPARYLERVNYFRAFPHSLTFATHLREDLDVIDHFAGHAACQEGRLNAALDSFAPIEALLSPAVCYHLYFMLADKPLPGGQVIATAVGNCFRYEAINLTTLERLWNFTMREVIFVGSKDFVLAQRDTARQRMSQVFKEIGLAYRVESANDPFFIGEFRKQAAFQSAFQLKYEIRARLPFKDSTLAVGSYNYHQDFFGRALNITLPDGGPAHTGCAAFGLERIVFAFLAQFGLDPAGWPKIVRETIA